MSANNELSAANKALQEAWRVYREALKARNKVEEATGNYRCSVCLETPVDPSEGVDTCIKCLP